MSAIASADGQLVTLAVEDHGPGVPVHLQQQIFDPFFTTRSNGTGLGLAVVQAVAHSHNGQVRCVTGKSGGARFEILLPVYQPVATSTHLTVMTDTIAVTNSTEEQHNAAH